jgi:hypothetical protein
MTSSAEGVKRWRKRHPEAAREAGRVARAKERVERPAVLAARKSRYYQKHKQAIQARKQGLSLEQWQALFDAQGGRCAVCNEAVETLCVDHDHACCPGPRSCGRCVRGLVCHGCNKLLGFAHDEPAILAAAGAYLLSRRVNEILG